MATSPMVYTIVLLSSLGMAWLVLREKVAKLDAGIAYHVAAAQRDQRKARFYGQSVWIAIAASSLGLIVTSVIATSGGKSTPTSQMCVGLAYGLGLWGLMVISSVWSQVGKRASLTNADGKSLIPHNARTGHEEQR